jgi:hypothetical protein
MSRELRDILYRKTADVTVETDDLAPDQVVQEVYKIVTKLDDAGRSILDTGCPKLSMLCNRTLGNQ